MADYIVTCSKCRWSGEPTETHRLVSDAENEHFDFQDLAIGACGQCSATVMGWYGIADDEVGNYFPISVKKHKVWMDRLMTDKVEPPTPKGATRVTGSERQFPWRFLPSIPVR